YHRRHHVKLADDVDLNEARNEAIGPAKKNHDQRDNKKHKSFGEPHDALRAASNDVRLASSTEIATTGLKGKGRFARRETLTFRPEPFYADGSVVGSPF